MRHQTWEAGNEDAGNPNRTFELQEEVKYLRERKRTAYHERNQLVAFVSALYPSSLGRHPEEDLEWEDDWRWIVFVDGPGGQMSWHIHDSELLLFSHVPRDQVRVWDGHDTEEKYRRLDNAGQIEAIARKVFPDLTSTDKENA